MCFLVKNLFKNSRGGPNLHFTMHKFKPASLDPQITHVIYYCGEILENKADV